MAEKVAKGASLEDVPNLSYREPDGSVKVNLKARPKLSIDEYHFTNLRLIEPRYVLLNAPLAAKGLKFWNLPVCRGCTLDCVTCGGSEYAYRNIFGREKPAFRSPQRIVEDFKELDDQGINFIFLFQDCRMGSKTYYEDLLRRLHREKWSKIESVCMELFDPLDDEFMHCLTSNKPADRILLKMSPESGSESVRYLQGRRYTNESVFHTLSKCEAKSLPIDFHFMIGLGLESPDSLKETWALWEKILARNKTPGSLRLSTSLRCCCWTQGQSHTNSRRNMATRCWPRTSLKCIGSCPAQSGLTG